MTEQIPVNTPPCGVAKTVTAHYRKDGTSNILSDTSSLMKAQAVLLRYE